MNKKVMIVDDEQDILFSLRILFEQRGYEVVTVDDGAKCIKELEKGFSGVVLMDIMMPVMDGATAIWHLKQNETTKHIPILVLSAYTKGDQAKRAMDVGATELVSKSLILTDLIDKVKIYLE